MDVRFSPLDVLAFLAVPIAAATGALALVLWAAYRWVLRPGHGAKLLRASALISTGVFAFFLAYIVVYWTNMMIQDRADSAQARQWALQHTRTLSSPMELAGGELPSGTLVSVDDHNRIISALVSKVATIDGVRLMGSVSFSRDGHADGYVANVDDQSIDGIPCRSKSVILEGGHLGGCTLATTYNTHGQLWPPGSYVATNQDGSIFFIRVGEATTWFRATPRPKL
ncbi:MAG TPA: hypothetical protein VGQ96_03810 [Candidatus Eremiobacteraceae bacterium]|nr:hypothetical protein [Candidatus Eremiobacteraceae bacterium]